MLVPSNRLLVWSAATLLPCALAGACVPQAWPLAAMLISLVLFFACADAWRGASALDGWELSVPDVTRLVCGRRGDVDCVLAVPPSPRERRLRAALALPPEIGSLDETIGGRVAVGAGRIRLAWPCEPRSRGLYPLRLAACETDSPWRCWLVVRRLPLACELRVYPDLRDERRRAAAVFLARGGFGVRMQRWIGKGREFEKLREYVPGDDPGDIHWKATARRRFPITKVFRSERTQEVYVVLDISRLSGAPIKTGGAESSVLEQFIRSALMLILTAEEQGDRCGLLVFHRRVAAFIPAGAGRHHFDACRNVLYTAVTEAVSPDFHELFAFVRTHIPKRALLVFLTDLAPAALADAFLQSARLVTRQHLLSVPLLTSGDAAPLFAGEAPGTLDDAWRQLAGHLQWRHLQELERRLRVAGVRTVLAPAEKATAVLVSQYLAVKERQLL